MTRLGLYTRFTTSEGQRDRVTELLLRGATLMETAAGCQLYLVNVSPDEPDTIWVTEVWDSQEHHRASLFIEGVPDVIARAMPLLAARPEQIRLTPIGGKGL